MEYGTVLLFGLVVGATFGPIAIAIMNAGVMLGLRPAVYSAFGAAAADFCYAAVAFTGIYGLSEYVNNNRTSVTAISGTVLVGFGLFLIIKAIAKSSDGALSDDGQPRLQGGFYPFLTTFLLTATNPITLLLFASLGLVTINPSSTAKVFTVALAVFAGSLAACLTYAALGSMIHHFKGITINRLYTNGFAGLLIIGIGFHALFNIDL